MRITFFLSLLFFPFFSLFSQTKVLNVFISDSTITFPPSKKTNNNKKQVEKELQEQLNPYIESGYITASIDSIVERSNAYEAYVYIGPKLLLNDIDAGNVDEELLSKTGYKTKLSNSNRALTPKELTKFYKTVISLLEDEGYPFASIKLKQISIKENMVNGKLHLNKGERIKINEVKIFGKTKINKSYVSNYLGVKPGNVYNESALQNIPVRISEIPFLTLTNSPEVEFNTKNEATVTLPLARRKANAFDGVLGFQPDNQTGKIVLTGDIKMLFRNALGFGENIDLIWKQLQDNTQNIKIETTFPFIFKTPLGINVKYEIYRRDTTFNSVNQYLGIPYYLKYGNYIKFFVQLEESNLISTQSSNAILSNADVGFLSYGLNFSSSRLNYKLNPRKGWGIKSEGAYGEKKITPNSAIPIETYDNISLSSNQWKATMTGSIYIPILKRATIKTSIKAGHINNAVLFDNELFRIGGLKTFRGFDEESMFVSSYGIGTIESRYLLDKNAFLAVFCDYGLTEKKTVTETVSNVGLGIGAGVAFQTKAGIFSLNYALGKMNEDPFILQNGKIHFGLINFF